MVEALKGWSLDGMEAGETRGKQERGVMSERMIWRAPIWALKRPKQAQTNADLGAKKSAQNGSVLMEKSGEYSEVEKRRGGRGTRLIAPVGLR